MLIWLWNLVIGKLDFKGMDVKQFQDLIGSFIPKLTDEQKQALVQAVVAGAVSGAMQGASKQ